MLLAFPVKITTNCKEMYHCNETTTNIKRKGKLEGKTHFFF